MDCKIEKEIESNEGDTMWSDRKLRLVACIVPMKSNCTNDKWEEQFTEIEAHIGMLAKGSALYIWKQNQTNKVRDVLDYKIEKEIEANQGSTVWSDRKVRLTGCIASKKSA